MPKVYVSAGYVLSRTTSLMNDVSVDLMRVPVPSPVIFPLVHKVKVYKLTHIERAAYEDGGMSPPIAVWGPLERPEFVIDELPY